MSPRPSPTTPPNWAWRAGRGAAARRSSSTSTACSPTPSARQHFIERGRRDWDGLLRGLRRRPGHRGDRPPARAARPALSVVLLTGRPLRVQPQTLAWLDRYGLRWDLLVMRDRGDYSQVTWFKRGVVDDLRAYGFDLRLAFEDDPSNHAMFEAEGHPLRLHPLGLLRVARCAAPAPVPAPSVPDGPAAADAARARRPEHGEVAQRTGRGSPGPQAPRVARATWRRPEGAASRAPSPRGRRTRE